MVILPYEVIVVGGNDKLSKYLAASFHCRKVRSHEINNIVQVSEKSKIFLYMASHNRISYLDGDIKSALEANIVGIQRCLSFDNAKVILFSSVDVYGSNSATPEFTEDSPVSPKSFYGLFKSISEALLQSTETSLVLRLGALIDQRARTSTVSRIANGERGPFSLSAQSSFQFISYQEVESFVRMALTDDLSGIFNLAHSEPVTLQTLADKYRQQFHFGEYIYQAPLVQVQKASRYLPELISVTSLELFESTYG